MSLEEVVTDTMGAWKGAKVGAESGKALEAKYAVLGDASAAALVASELAPPPRAAREAPLAVNETVRSGPSVFRRDDGGLTSGKTNQRTLTQRKLFSEFADLVREMKDARLPVGIVADLAAGSCASQQQATAAELAARLHTLIDNAEAVCREALEDEDGYATDETEVNISAGEDLEHEGKSSSSNSPTSGNVGVLAATPTPRCCPHAIQLGAPNQCPPATAVFECRQGEPEGGGLDSLGAELDQLQRQQKDEEENEALRVRAQRQCMELHPSMTPGAAEQALRACGLRTSALSSETHDNKDLQDPQETEVELSTEQAYALQKVLEGHNVFVTGSAGVGKSILVKRMVDDLRMEGKKVSITAPTGIAAVAIGGTTIHSFSGMGVGDKKKEVLAGIVAESSSARERWLTTDVLVIDEVSMMEDEKLEKLDYIARWIRGFKNDQNKWTLDPRPMGGIQVVLVGDFFQLPPVNKDKPPKYAFEGPTWTAFKLLPVYLTKVFRQGNKEFIKLLHEIREGLCSPASQRILAACTGRPEPTDGIKPTRLSPRRQEVQCMNLKEYKSLPGREISFKAEDGTDNGAKATLLEAFKKDCQAPKELVLKVGTQVVLLSNMDVDHGLANGTRGVVTGFRRTLDWLNDTNVLNDATEMPMRGEGEGGGMELNPKQIRNQERFGPHGIFRAFLLAHEFLPLVHFACLPAPMVVPPWQFEREVGGAKAKVWRKQLPLAHAWALTIHKCQGMSLDRASLSLDQCFADGQAYVALSRVRDLEGLYLETFSACKVKASPKVHSFYAQLPRINPTEPAICGRRRVQLNEPRPTALERLAREHTAAAFAQFTETCRQEIHRVTQAGWLRAVHAVAASRVAEVPGCSSGSARQHEGSCHADDAVPGCEEVVRRRKAAGVHRLQRPGKATRGPGCETAMPPFRIPRPTAQSSLTPATTGSEEADIIDLTTSE